MTDLDSLIDSQHAAAEAAEHEALTVIERLHGIKGIEPWLTSALRNRRYGQTPSPWVDANLSGQAAILQADRKLAAWLASKSGHSIAAPDYAAQQAKQKQAEAAERLVAETERLRAHNQALRQRQEHERTYGRFDPFLGKVV